LPIRQRGGAAKREQQVSGGPAELIEAYLARWLRESELGRLTVEGMGGFDAAMAAMWEALNAGAIKLEADADGFTGIRMCNPPQRPTTNIARPLARVPASPA
jgi:hypothetical protein